MYTQCYDPRTWLGNSTCYKHQSYYTRRAARSTENTKARTITPARRRRASVEHVRARQGKTSDEYAQLYKTTIFFLKKNSYKFSCYIIINLIVFITKTLLLPWYLPLFNIFLNLTRLPSRNIICTTDSARTKKNTKSTATIARLTHTPCSTFLTSENEKQLNKPRPKKGKSAIYIKNIDFWNN